jgi:hypothetical protein
MSEDEYQTAKIGAERLRDYLFEIARRAMAPDQPKYILKSDDLNTLGDGRLFLENGMRDLTRIVDQSNFGTLGYEAMQQIIRGAFYIGCCAVYPDSHKIFIDRQKSSRGGKKGSIGRIEKKELWQRHVRKRVAELHRNKPTLTGTFIRDSIKRVPPPPGVHLPKDRNDRTLYEFILAELKNLKRGPVPPAKNSLRVKYFGRV